jgi:hypothetical protein
VVWSWVGTLVVARPGGWGHNHLPYHCRFHSPTHSLVVARRPMPNTLWENATGDHKGPPPTSSPRSPLLYSGTTRPQYGSLCPVDSHLSSNDPAKIYSCTSPTISNTCNTSAVSCSSSPLVNSSASRSPSHRRCTASLRCHPFPSKSASTPSISPL